MNLPGRLLPTGSLTVITGSMFSGKTEELIRQIHRARYARRRVQVFKPALDTRTDDDSIRSHSGLDHDAIAVPDSRALRAALLSETQVVAIEEVQFFDSQITSVCTELADSGHVVLASGLDMDFRGCPFGPMPALLALADTVVKLRAICARCGADASRSQRLFDGRPAPSSAPTVLIGAQERYEARCRHCHEVPAG